MYNKLLITVCSLALACIAQPAVASQLEVKSQKNDPLNDFEANPEMFVAAVCNNCKAYDERSIYWLERAIRTPVKGRWDAARRLGYLYNFRESENPISDRIYAFCLYTFASNQKDDQAIAHEALYSKAYLYEDERLSVHDYKKAYAIYMRLACTAECLDLRKHALQALARLYRLGYGVEINVSKAQEFEQASACYEFWYKKR